MATERQKALARAIVENASLDKPLNGGELLENVGYSANLVKQPGRIIETAGVQEELAILGFSELNAKTVVQEIMLNGDVDPSARLKATDQVFKVIGAYAPDRNINININSEQTAEQKIKGELFNEWLKTQTA